MEESEKQSVKEAIEQHVYPAEVVGDISKYEEEWRALVAVRPSGPLLLMAFKISSRPAGDTSNQRDTGEGFGLLGNRPFRG